MIRSDHYTRNGAADYFKEKQPEQTPLKNRRTTPFFQPQPTTNKTKNRTLIPVSLAKNFILQKALFLLSTKEKSDAMEIKI